MVAAHTWAQGFEDPQACSGERRGLPLHMGCWVSGVSPPRLPCLHPALVPSPNSPLLHRWHPALALPQPPPRVHPIWLLFLPQPALLPALLCPSDPGSSSQDLCAQACSTDAVYELRRAWRVCMPSLPACAPLTRVLPSPGCTTAHRSPSIVDCLQLPAHSLPLWASHCHRVAIPSAHVIYSCMPAWDWVGVWGRLGDKGSAVGGEVCFSHGGGQCFQRLCLLLSFLRLSCFCPVPFSSCSCFSSALSVAHGLFFARGSEVCQRGSFLKFCGSPLCNTTVGCLTFC